MRIVRALEVFEVTGKPISQLQKNRQGLSDKYDVRVLCLTMPPDKLNKRIDARVERMFKAGVVKEVKALIRRRLSKTAAAAIGIKEIKGYLQGEFSLQYAKELMQRNTRRFAKKQMTWFRKDKRIRWITLNERQGPVEVAVKIKNKLKN